VLTLAFDKLGLKSNEIWNKLEVSIDKLLHKLKAQQIVFILNLFNKDSVRASKDFYVKLFTILPIHVQSLSLKEVNQLLRVYMDQGIQNERLLKYFVYPRIEKKIPDIKLDLYIETLNLLAEMGYDEDKIFWSDHILPIIFGYNYVNDDINKLWHVLLKLKVNCPSIDLAKYMLVVENLIKQFNILKEKGEDLTKLTLSVDEQFRTIPKKTDLMSSTRIKEAEKRLKHQPSLQGLLEGKEGVPKSETLESSFTGIMNIKDWNKAKYEMDQAELKKAREARQEDVEAKKKLMAEKKEARKKEEEEKKSREDLIKKKTTGEPKVVDIEPAAESETVKAAEDVKVVKKEGKKDGGDKRGRKK
jgi:hypothetical protein